MEPDKVPPDIISKILPLTKEQFNALILRLEENKLTKEDMLILQKFLSDRTVRKFILIYKILLKIIGIKYFLSLWEFICLKRKSRK